MHVFRLFPMWLFTIFCCYQDVYASTSSADNESLENEFFDQVKKMFGKLIPESETVDDTSQHSDSRKLRYLIPEAVENQEREEQSIYRHKNKLGENEINLSSHQNSPFYSLDNMDERNSIMDFEGNQEFVFRPIYPCDSYDPIQRHCVLRRQLGTTLTLGVEVGEGLHTGKRIFWYRCLRKKYFDHIIKEPLQKGFLPWNLNLGGSGNELRISPISEMDLSYNYFVAELVTPRMYRGRYGQKLVMRFDIESIEIDMGSLYAGEEIVIYARSFMQLPRTSVSFLWSLQGRDDLEDHGLPSNMQLNNDKSSVIIKELKTYQDLYLVCKVFTNKDSLLAKRTFLFRGFGRNKTNTASNYTRRKRYAVDTEQPYSESNEMQYDEIENLSNMAQSHDGAKDHKHFTNTETNYFQVPAISSNLFYDNRQEDANKWQDSSYKFSHSLSQGTMSRLMRRFIQKNEREMNKPYRPKKRSHFEKPKFEDKESQMIATCRTHSGCNIRATCIRESNYGQNYCQCTHNFNGNGLFCYSS